METLKNYGFQRIGSMTATRDGVFHLEIFDKDLAATRRGIYAWVIGYEIVRIGSSKNRLGERFKASRNWLTNRIQGTAKISNPKRLAKELADAERWFDCLATNGQRADVWGRGGSEVLTPIGVVNTYLAEENMLLERY